MADLRQMMDRAAARPEREPDVQEAFRKGRRARIARFGGMSLAAMASVTAIALVAANLTTPERERIAPAPGVQEGRITFSRSGEGGGIMTMNADGSDVAQIATTDFSVLSEPRWSPDGTKIAFHGFYGRAANQAGGLFVMNADGSNRYQLALGGDMPTWSPDGGRVAFYMNGSLYVAPSEGGEARLLTDDVESPDWSPDGDRIAFIRGQDLYIVPSDGGAPTKILDNAGESKAGPHPFPFDPEWSPDGSHIGFTSQGGSPEENQIAMVPSGGGKVTYITTGSSPTWSPDSTRLAFERIEGTNTSHIYSMNVDGSDERQLTFGDVADHSPDWGVIEATPEPAPTESDEGWTSYSNDEDAFSVEYPSDWTRAETSLTPNLSDPVEILSIGGDMPLRPGGDRCAHVPVQALDDFGMNSVFYSIQEAHSTDGFDDRPSDLRDLATSEAENNEIIDCVAPEPGEREDFEHLWWLRFKDGDRAFYAIVAIGIHAGEVKQDQLWRSLNSFTPTGNGCNDPDNDLSKEPKYSVNYIHRWQDADGCDVRFDILMTRQGADACGGAKVADILMGTPLGLPSDSSPARIYVKDPDNVFGDRETSDPFDPDAELPAAASDSGYRQDGFQLWTVPDEPRYIFLVSEDRVERWPLDETPPECG